MATSHPTLHATAPVGSSSCDSARFPFTRFIAAFCFSFLPPSSGLPLCTENFCFRWAFTWSFTFFSFVACFLICPFFRFSFLDFPLLHLLSVFLVLCFHSSLFAAAFIFTFSSSYLLRVLPIVFVVTVFFLEVSFLELVPEFRDYAGDYAVIRALSFLIIVIYLLFMSVALSLFLFFASCSFRASSSSLPLLGHFLIILSQDDEEMP